MWYNLTMSSTWRHYDLARSLAILSTLAIAACILANCYVIAKELVFCYRFVVIANELLIVFAAFCVFSTSNRLRIGARCSLLASTVFLGSHLVNSSEFWQWNGKPDKSPTAALATYFWRLLHPTDFVFDSETSLYRPANELFFYFEPGGPFRAVVVLSIGFWISAAMFIVGMMVFQRVNAPTTRRVSWRITILQLLCIITVLSVYIGLLRINSVHKVRYLGIAGEVCSIFSVALFAVSKKWRHLATQWLIVFYSYLGFLFALYASDLGFAFPLSLTGTTTTLFQNVVTEGRWNFDPINEAHWLSSIYAGHGFILQTGLCLASIATLMKLFSAADFFQSKDNPDSHKSCR
jgi:hypothetical protein